MDTYMCKSKNSWEQRIPVDYSVCLWEGVAGEGMDHETLDLPVMFNFL